MTNLPQSPLYQAIESLFTVLERLEYDVQERLGQENSTLMQENAMLIQQNEGLKLQLFELGQQYNELQTMSKTISDKLDNHIEQLAQILEVSR